MVHVLTHYTPNWKEIADITVPVMRQYCEKQGYAFHVKEVPTYEKYNGLEKLQMLNALEENDIALVLDADVLLTNHIKKVEDYFHYDELSLSKGANCGVMIIRKLNRGVVDLIVEDIRHGRFNCEQDAVESYLSSHSGYYSIGIFDHPAFNSYLPHLYPEIKEEKTEQDGMWVKGHFCLHVPALSIEKRIEVLKEYSQYIIYE